MAAENSRSSSSAADSYVGSLISLTSKSEIRYEGILYNIDTEESSIGLRNVRSFGTEGRKKDGLQVMPSDKVYEYILFRGSDIKDLQVKSSPPVQPPIQTTLPINHDPAIIQSHYPRPSATSSSLLPAGTGSTDIGTHTTQLGQPGLTYQSGMPLYQPGGNLGSWGPSPPPPPSANGNGLAMPMYWPGYYAPQNGLPQLHQQSLLRPPPGLSIPPSMQQQVQYPAFNTSLPTGPSNLPEYPMPLLPTTTTSSPNLTSTTTLPSSLPPVPPVTLSLEAFPSFMQNKASNSVIPNAALNSTSLPLLSPFTTSSPDGNAIVPPISTKPIATPALPYQANPQPISQPISFVVGISSSKLPETATPSLVTPGQLLHSGQTTVSSSQTTSQTARKDVEVVQVSPSTTSEPPAPITTEAESPILPLPLPSRTVQKPNGASYQTHQDNNYRGHARGRGTGIYRPVMKFTEEFDFTAMNEKFKKDEVWGHLGKSNKSNLKGDGNASEEDHYEEEDDAELLKFDVKPVYSKDDFFDTFSFNALDNQSNNGRTRFSEQMKLDTETFGEFSRYRGGWGGRGLGRGGRGPGQGGPSRGGYYGRGYGYAGRGRVRSMPSRDY